jgi:hypothetical protein
MQNDPIFATFDTTPSPHWRTNAASLLLAFAHIHGEAGTPALGIRSAVVGRNERFYVQNGWIISMQNDPILATFDTTPSCRLAMDICESQKQSSCIGSPMRRRGGVECSENGVVLHGNNQPFLHIEPDRSALLMPKAGVPASPWIWAKARSNPAALIHQCGIFPVEHNLIKMVTSELKFAVC